MSSKSEKTTPQESTHHVSQYQVVARRYRPQGFAQLVGQRHVSQALSNAIQTGRIGHAYLFTGARGVGKTSSARIFAKALNCVHGPTPTPCNVCEICEAISTGDDVDVLEIDGASNRGIDEIRQLRQNATIRPSRAHFKIYIIDEVHMLTREAFNALLKTLEEPPEHVKFIFCTTEPSKIPITILSRCQRYDFAGIDAGAIADRLQEIATKEGVAADDGVFDTLSRRAAGSMRDAQSLLEQLLSFAPEHITMVDVHGMLGTADDQRIFRILQSLVTSEAAAVFAELDEAAQEGVDFGIFTEQLLGVFRDLMLSACQGDKKLLTFCSPSRYDEVKQLARDFDLPRILAALQILDQTYTKMRYSTQGRILLELALVRIAHLQQLQGVAVLLDQIRQGTLNIPDASIPAVTAPTSNSQILQPPQVSQVPQSPPVQPPPVQADAQKKTADLTELNFDSSRLETSEAEYGSPATQGGCERPKATAHTGCGIDDHAARRLWDSMSEQLSVMTATQTSLAQSVRFIPPDVLVVSFLSTQPLAKSYCENELTKLQSILGHLAGTPLRVRFETLTVDEPQKAAVARPQNPAVQKARLVAEASDHPLIKKAAELFGANVSDVKSPRS